MVEQDAGRAMHLVRLAVVARQIEPGNFADSVWAARVEPCPLGLRTFFHLAEHLARSGEVESAVRLRFSDGRKHVMRTVDIGLHRREAVIETLSDEALRGEVVALVELVAAENMEQAGVALQRSGMQR